MSYCILRTKKIKDIAKITAMSKHNLRLRTQRNIDSEKTKDNLILLNSLNVDTTIANDFQIKVNDYYNDLKIKIRNDNVLMLEFVLTASPQFFNNKTKEEVLEWANSQLAFMKDEFGEQLKFAVLHLDEKTPHLHVNITTEHKTEKKYKNQYGEYFKTSYSLNAKRYNPEFLVGLQDRFAAFNSRYNLRRGMRRSEKKHTSLKKFYRFIDSIKNIDVKKKVEDIIDSVKIPWLRTDSNIYEAFKSNILEKLDNVIKASYHTKKLTEFNYEKAYTEIKETKKEIEEEKRKITDEKDYLKLKSEDIRKLQAELSIDLADIKQVYNNLPKQQQDIEEVKNGKKWGFNS